MTSVVGTSATVIPSSLFVFLLPRRTRFTLHSPRLLFFEAFTAKLHSHRLRVGKLFACVCDCHGRVTNVLRELHGHSAILVDISASVSNKSNVYYKLFHNCPAVSLSAGRGGSPEDIPYDSAFQSAVTEARL